ncbi:hypothetical protein [Herbidospora cretacea]|uniref:nSTAND1 domain-containing NTPase n=1 Tax=Herbidospora cretacea TaxID=28444 RepID=UPI0004C34FE8|nr:hypothetical protein [Herbidospora cretacea]
MRARITDAGGALLRLSPYALLAALAASALTPLAPLTGAAFGIVAGVGTNVLSEIIVRAVDNLRIRLGRAPTEDELEGELTDRLIEALTADEDGRAKTELALVLRQLDTVGAAMQAAVEFGDERLQRHLTDAFTQLSTDFAGFHILVEAVYVRTGEIQRVLHRLDAEHRGDRERLRRQSLQLLAIREDLARHSVPEAPQGSRRRATWPGGSPYRGLWPFNQEHADIFYGRERATIALAAKLSEQLSGPPFLVVTGPSGAGKSSLVRAGLLPAVSRGLLPVPGSGEWPQVVLTPTGAPLDELAIHLANVGRTDPSTVLTGLRETPRLMFRQLAMSSGRVNGSRLLLVVDQFEEVFTQNGDSTHAQEFMAALLAAVTDPDPQVVVVICVRADYWGHCVAYPGLADLLPDGQFIVGPMSEAELRRAITAPAAAAGLDLEPGLVETILGDLDTSSAVGAYGIGVLPLVSQSMLLAWEAREGDRLTIRGYGISGGVAGVVESSAEAAFTALTVDQREAIRRFFQVAVAVQPDGRLARRQVRRTGLHPDLSTALGALADKRLLVLNQGTVEISHDVVLHAWPRLRGWLEDDVADRIQHSQILHDATEWDQTNHNPAFLYRGSRLEEAQSAAAHWRADPARYPALVASEVVEDFLTAGGQAATRLRHRWQAAVGGLAGLLVISIITAVAAVSFARDADRQKAAALQSNAQILSQQAAAYSSSESVFADPAVSARLAAAAWWISPTDEASASMVSLLSRPQRAVLTHPDGVDSVVFSPDGARLASGGGDGTVRIWDARTGTPIGKPLTGHTSAVTSVAFSPDGSRLASGGSGGDGTVRIWDARTGTPIGKPLNRHTSGVTSVAFSPDGARLASGSRDGTVRIWDARTGTPIGKPLTGHTRGVDSVAFSPDGSRLASGGSGRNEVVRMWDPDTGQQIGEPLIGPPDGVLSVAFSPDGARLVAGDSGGSGMVRIWDVRTGMPIGAPLAGHTSGVASVAFSPECRSAPPSLATPVGWPRWRFPLNANENGTVRIWDARTGAPIGEPIASHASGVASVIFSPDGTRLASGGDDGMVLMWDARTGAPIGKPLTGHTVRVTSVVFSPDSTRLASSGNDGMVLMWDARTGAPIGKPLPGDALSVESVAFSPDGTRLASGGVDGMVRMWDARTGTPIGKPLTGHATMVTSVAFSPDGTRLASSSEDRTVRMWNVRTGAPIGEPLTGHTNGVLSVAFSPDGSRLASGGRGGDDTVRMWDVALPPDLLAATCAIAGRGFTRQEWQQYLPNTGYRATCPAVR